MDTEEIVEVKIVAWKPNCEPYNSENPTNKIKITVTKEVSITEERDVTDDQLESIRIGDNPFLDEYVGRMKYMAEEYSCSYEIINE